MSPMDGEREVKPLEVVVLEGLEIEPDPAETRRYMGYPVAAVPFSRVEERILEAIRISRGAMRPRGTYSLYSVTSRAERSLTLGGKVKFTGAIGDYLGHAERAAAFLATAGEEIVELAERAMRSGDALGGLVLNALGSQVAEAVVSRLVEDLRRHAAPGEALSLRYSPGYCGISLAQQQTIFRLVEASKVGVELLPTLIMKPVKSVSGLIGIGPESAVKAYGNPCDRCNYLDCRMRR